MKEEQEYTDKDMDEEYMEYARTKNQREHYWRIFFTDKKRGVDDKKEIIHAKR